jgi:hypothetical protein
MKFKKYILILFSCVLLTINVNADNVNVLDTDWKISLAEFFMQFPSIFDRAYAEYNHAHRIIPADAIDYYHPFAFKFYDFDGDGVPEVLIMFGIPDSCAVSHAVYKLYDGVYEMIGGGWGWRNNTFHFDSQDRLVRAYRRDYHEASIDFMEIRDKQIIYTDYIGVSGVNYNEYGDYDFWQPYISGESPEQVAGRWAEFLEQESLATLPEFDCSDIVQYVRYLFENNKPLVIPAPKTNDNIILICGVFILTSLIFLRTSRYRQF